MIRVKIDIRWLEAVDGDGVIVTIDSDGEVFVSPCDNRIWSIVWWLQWFSNSIMTDKHVCCC